MKLRIRKIILYIFLSIVALALILYFVLRSSPVQNYLIGNLTSYFSKELRTDVKVGGVNFGLWGIILEDVSINDLHRNPLFYIEKLKLSIGRIKIQKKAFLLRRLSVDRAYINLVKYKNDSIFNYQFILNYFSGRDTTGKTSQNKWIFRLNALYFRDCRITFNYFNINGLRKGFDFNNFGISNLNIRINNIEINRDTISADIKNIAFNERKGFMLNSFSCRTKFTPDAIIIKGLVLKTPKSNIALDCRLNYKDLSAFNDFEDKVDINADIHSSIINLNDIGYFMPEMFGMNNPVTVSGEITGRVSSLFCNTFRIGYGTYTGFKGNLSLKGLPDFENTYISLNAEKLTIAKADLESFSLPDNGNSASFIPKKITVPEIFSRLGNLYIKGVFSGYYYDFISRAEINTAVGKVNTDLSLKIFKNEKSGKRNKLEYSGKVNAFDLDIGKLTAINDFGKADFKINIYGNGIDKNDSIGLIGVIDTIKFRNYSYNNIDLEGKVSKQKFEGYFKVKDENIYLDFDGLVDFNQAKPVMKFASNIKDAYLNRLNLVKKDSNARLSSVILVNIEGDKIDNLEGDIEVHDTKYSAGKETYILNNLTFSVLQDDSNRKFLKLKSDFIDADIKGSFVFSQLYNSFTNLLNAYLPSFYKIEAKSKGSRKKEVINNPDSEQKFEYVVNLKKTEVISKLFFPFIKFADSAEIKGRYNSFANTFTVSGNTSILTVNSNKYKNWFIDATAQNGVIRFNTGCRRMSLSDSLWLDNLKFSSIANNDTLKYKIEWNNNQKINNTNADINGIVSFRDSPGILMRMLPSLITVSDTTWEITSGNYMVFDSSSVSVNDLSFISKNQMITIDGKISKNADEKLKIGFKNFNVSNLDYFMEANDIDIDGIMNGEISLSNIYKSPEAIASLNIKNLVFNNDRLGDLIISSQYDSRKKAISANADIIYSGSAGISKIISIAGAYYPEGKTGNFDFDIDINNLRLQWLGHYFSDFSSDFNGFVYGKLKLSGSSESPELTGNVKLAHSKIKIDYLNTYYSLAGDVIFNKNDITFDNVVFYGNNKIDPKNSKGILSGMIYHKFFNKMRLALDIKAQNLACLNTNVNQNNLYYGNAIISGDLKISGTVDNILMNVDAKSEKGTKIYIPLNIPEELTENDFITFINSRQEGQNVKHDSYKVNLNGVQMNFNLAATHDAEIQLLFDPKIGDVIKARGKGDIKLEINTNGEFNMYGDYIVEEGDYLFTLKNIINKRFIIEKGARISWSGNPYEGTINMQAIYKVRTSLDVLRPDLASESVTTHKKIPVNCNIFLTEQLLMPAISFSITFPEHLNDMSLEPYKSVIEPELNKQVFSLLVLRSFTTPAQYKGYESPNGSSAISNNSTELLSNQLSNWLSQINKDFDIGVKYRAGDQMTSDQVEVALGTQLFNNRLIINGNIGVGGEKKQQSSQSSNTSNIVGDVNIEYKLTPEGRLRIKAFNKSNVNDYLNFNSPYTQGLGIFYRKSFDRLKELFSKKAGE